MGLDVAPAMLTPAATIPSESIVKGTICRIRNIAIGATFRALDEPEGAANDT